MRYVKKITEYQNEYDAEGNITNSIASGRVIEYQGPGMGRTWFTAHGWIEYEGVLSVSRLDVIDGVPVELPAPEAVPEPRIISKLKLRDALPAEAWALLRAALEAQGEYERFLLAHDISEADPGFVDICTQLRPALAAAGIDLDELLNHCIMERY